MQKFILFFVPFVFVSLLYAQDASSLADEAQGKADKIAGVVSELQSLASEASSSGDSKLKACVEKRIVESQPWYKVPLFQHPKVTVTVTGAELQL